MNDIANLLVAATPGGIEAQERRGQDAFAHSDTLPIKFNSGSRAELEQFGVKFGEPVDDLFCRVELPAGWKRGTTDHRLWSCLLNEKGRERASIFYKAAFYDKDAFINVLPRYQVSAYEPCDAEGRAVDKYDDNTHWTTVVLDAGKPLRVFGIRPDRCNDRELNAKAKALRDEHADAAYAWLKENYPDYESHTAYWEAE
jgi:hypothetical protein